MCNKLFLSMLALVFLTASQVQANLLENGDFDLDPGTLSNGNWGYFASLPSSVPMQDSWVGSNNIELQTQATLGVTPHSGDYYAEINAHPAQDMSFSWGQSFDTQTNMIYKVVFWYRSRQADDGVFSVKVGNSVEGGQQNIVNNDSSDWQMYMFTFTAEGSIASLDFISLDEGTDTVGHLIDSVSVTKVPVPAAVWLFGTALAGLFAARSRKVKS